MKNFISFLVVFNRYYDYALFGMYSRFLSEYFFPGMSRDDKLLNFFLVYVFTFIGKLVGSLLLGVVADRFDKERTVKISSILATISIAAIVVIPGYNKLGIISTCLLILARLIFLSTVSIESDTIYIFLMEKIRYKYKTLMNSVAHFYSQTGVVFAAYVHYLTISVDIPNFWKIGFAIGSTLGVINMVLLLLFYRANSLGNQKNKKYFRKNLKQVLGGVGQHLGLFIQYSFIHGCIGGIYSFYIIFLFNFHVTKNFLVQEIASVTNIRLIVMYSLSCLLSGMLRVQCRASTQILISLSISVALVLVQLFFINIKTDFKLILMLQSAIIFFIPFYALPIRTCMQGFIKQNIKVSLYGFAHALGSICISSTVPFLGLKIWDVTHSYAKILIYPMLLFGLLTISVFKDRKFLYY